MEWYVVILVFFGSLIFLMATGMPVAFAFLMLNCIFMFIFWGGLPGIHQLTRSIFASVATFTILPIPLFLLMAEVLFRTGMAPRMITVVDKWMGRVPGRLGLIAVGSGTILGTLSGSSMGSTAVLGSTLVPEMEKRGYKKAMSLGPILGSGGLAMMIPPSGLAVLLGAIGEISIGKILIAIIVPGLLMAVLYATYIITRCGLQPSIAPAYDIIPKPPLSEKLIDTARYVLPLVFIIFMVTGLIFLGIATPGEAAASGALSTLILAACYRKLSWAVAKEAFFNALQTVVMMFIMVAGAIAFSQVVAYSGASRGLVAFTLGLPLPPIITVALMLAMSLLLGMFIALGPIIMLLVPLFRPVLVAFGFDLVWFAAMFLLTLEMGATSPPVGLSLFVMKGVAPPDTTLGDCYRAALPFLGVDLIVVILLLSFPIIVQWLPALMR